MRSYNEYTDFLGRVEARGLMLLSDFSNARMLVLSLNDIIPGEAYEIISLHLKRMSRQQRMNVTNFFNEMYKLPVKIFPTRTMYSQPVYLHTVGADRFLCK